MAVTSKKHTEMMLAKIKLEVAIHDLVTKFQEETGLVVTSISFDQKIRYINQPEHDIHKVEYGGHDVTIKAEIK